MTTGYEYTGYESAFVPTPSEKPTDSSNLERKTPPANADKKTDEAVNKTQGYIQSKYSNVLNGYRSITYNFTLAGLLSDWSNNPDAYRESDLKLVIAKSGGKALRGIQAQTELSPLQTSNVKEEIVYDKFSAQNNKRKANEALSDNQSLVSSFNKESPGRFDMFIEDVEVETSMAFQNNTNISLPTKIQFDIIEPYSVNGFIEALHVAAIASGYTNYVSASYVLKLEFWGYPDDDTSAFGEPQIIPNATRYFPIGLASVDVDITERGTKYKCTAVPYNEREFGQPAIIKKPITMRGVNIKDILKNFMASINEQVKKADQDGKATSNKHDEYEIKFVKWEDDKGWVENESMELASSPVLKLYEDNILYKFAKPNEKNNAYKPGTTPKSIDYNPNSISINFQEGANIVDIITAVIRDSTYVRTLIEKLGQEDKVSSLVDDLGRIEYFLIKLEVTNLKEINLVTKKPYQKYSYIVSPYKIHFTRVPTYGSVAIKEEDFAKLSLREYNYIYTGKNLDIINFRLNFNMLYFEAVPAAMADQNTPNYRDSIKPSNSSKQKLKGNSVEEQKCANIAHPLPPIYDEVTPVQKTGGTAVPHQSDPYSQLARNMHEALINSKSSMITGEIEILGDPYYICTGGMGGYKPKPDKQRKFHVGEGEIPFDTGEVNITINFRNPIDIGPDGSYIFDPKRVPFSGIYMVTKCVNTFKDGLFKQKLDIIRKPGQILDDNCKPITPADVIQTTQNEDNVGRPSISADGAPSQRLSTAGVADYLSRGAPSNSSNFTNATGGLFGSLGSNQLTQAYGLVNRAGSLISNAGVIGQALPTDISSNIRLNVSNLAQTAQSAFSSAALLNVATNVLTGNVSAKSALSTLAGTIVGTSLNDALKRSNVGSGIGEGATISVPSALTDLTNITANDINFGALSNPVALAKDTISNIAGNVKNLGSNALDAVSELGKGADTLVKDIGNKVSSALGTVADPSALAAKVGLDASKLSGLSNNLQSKLPDQLKGIMDKVPENTNLTKSIAAGLAVDVIPPSKFPNLPPTASIMQAPEPSITGYLTAAQQLNPLKNLNLNSNVVDASIVKDKLATVKSQLGNLTNISNITDKLNPNAVSAKFGSKLSSSPLDSLVNKLNDPAAEPYTGTDPIVRQRLGLPPVG